MGDQDIIGLLFRIDADSKPAQADMEKFRGLMATELGHVESLFGRLGINLPTGFFGNLSRLSKTAQADLSGIGAGGGAAAQGLSAIGGPATAAIGVIIAATGAAIGLGKALFQMASEEAEAGSKVFDLSQKAAVSVETMSALGFAAKQSGSTVEEVAQGLVKFTNNLGEAEAGNKKLRAEMEQLGIKTFNDTEKALDEFLQHFAALRTDQERTQAASAVFGARMGASLVATFNTVGGNLDEFKKKMADLGVVMSSDFARDADRFGDLVDQIDTQVDGIKRRFVANFLPAMGDALQIISNELKSGGESWASWGNFVRDEIYGIISSHQHRA
ncbi:MAG: hypothetical protein AUG51_19365 [Acidobacteria bacterium 13_1_20CM_3_53_8]|nr:MAG: hypothetical protein AUG51_19365 [Acidobacteria bacterium 13_1_20CM_3_53_8]